MSLAIEGYGTIFATSPDGVTYTGVAEVSKIGGPNMEGKWVDVTHLLSPNGWMEFIPSLVDAGEIKLELNWTKTQYNSVISSFRPATPLFMKITFTTGSTLVMQGGLKSAGLEIPKDDKITNQLTFKITTKPTFTP